MKKLLFPLLILIFIAFLLHHYFRVFDLPEIITPSKSLSYEPAIYESGNLVADEVGYVANVFSWGYNRHICYDNEFKNWWIFYYGDLSNDPDKPNRNIQYRYSKNDGNTWSGSRQFKSNVVVSADFTIYCEAENISIAYGDIHQKNVYWQKGKMQVDDVEWYSKSVPIKSDVGYASVAPSIVYYNNLPVLAVRDQSEESKKSGEKRTFVAIAKDEHGNSWEKNVKIHSSIIRTPFDKYASPSLEIVNGELFAIINTGYDMRIVNYLLNNEWGEDRLISGFKYSGANLDWTTVTDSSGTLHIFYPEKDTSFARHATFDGSIWNFETITDYPISSNRHLSGAIDDNDTLYFIGNELALYYKTNNIWHVDKRLVSKLGLGMRFITASQKLVDNKLGIAWIEGDEFTPVIRFLCLQKIEKRNTISFKKCQ